MGKIIIAGGSGFIGQYLASKFRDKGDSVIIISRNKGDVRWNDKAKLPEALDGADVIINLTGKSVDCRYNEKNKREILRSRVASTMAIGDAVRLCKKPPKCWINSSTATIYRHAEDKPMTEADGEPDSGFSVHVAKEWEKAFFESSVPKTRQVALRMAIVLGRNGGVMRPLTALVRSGLGGKQGSGNQMFSWIHIEDLYKIILFVMDHNEIQGVLHCSSPLPVPNKKLMKSLRDVLHIKFGIRSPVWLLKLGAIVIRTETELILKSRWVLPQRLLQMGYKFAFPTLKTALEEILDRRN